MDAVSGVLGTIRDLGVVPVVVIDDPEHAEPLGDALMAGGLPCAEITFRTEAAAPAIGRLASALPELLVGAGTVLTVQQAEAALDAGSRFVVSPGFDDDVVEWCLRRRVPVVPGVQTATEMTRAVRAGLSLVKFFPSELAGGVDAIRSLSGVFPGMEFMATGGIDATNLASYLRLPSVAACGGSWLAPARLIADGDFGAIGERAAEAVAIARDARRSR